MLDIFSRGRSGLQAGQKDIDGKPNVLLIVQRSAEGALKFVIGFQSQLKM